MEKKLYVGNISYRATEEDLKKKFGEIGDCVAVTLVYDRFSGESKGIAFVEMATEEQAQAAIKKLNHTALYGRGIVVGYAHTRQERDTRRKRRYRS